MNYTLNVKRAIHRAQVLQILCGKERSNVHNRIQELRKERRITQSELADAVEVTRQTIISLENGKYNASLILAHKIAQFFGMTIEEIFIFDKEEENIC